jgi:hypothetical protein
VVPSEVHAEPLDGNEVEIVFHDAERFGFAERVPAYFALGVMFVGERSAGGAFVDGILEYRERFGQFLDVSWIRLQQKKGQFHGRFLTDAREESYQFR